MNLNKYIQIAIASICLIFCGIAYKIARDVVETSIITMLALCCYLWILLIVLDKNIFTKKSKQIFWYINKKHNIISYTQENDDYTFLALASFEEIHDLYGHEYYILLPKDYK